MDFTWNSPSQSSRAVLLEHFPSGRSRYWLCGSPWTHCNGGDGDSPLDSAVSERPVLIDLLQWTPLSVAFEWLTDPKPTFRILKWNILIKIHEIISFLWTAILRMAFWRSQSVIRHADNQRSDFNCFLPLWRRIPGEDSPAKKAKLWMNPVRALCPSSAFYRWHSDRFSSLRFFCKTKLSLSECQRNL